jgi:hypothetical protein
VGRTYPEFIDRLQPFGHGLQDEWSSGVDVSRFAQMFNDFEGVSGEMVETHAVAMGIDDGVQRSDWTVFVGIAADDFEHGLLGTVTVGFADLGDLPEPGVLVGRRSRSSVTAGTSTPRWTRSPRTVSELSAQVASTWIRAAWRWQ